MLPFFVFKIGFLLPAISKSDIYILTNEMYCYRLIHLFFMDFPVFQIIRTQWMLSGERASWPKYHIEPSYLLNVGLLTMPSAPIQRLSHFWHRPGGTPFLFGSFSIRTLSLKVALYVTQLSMKTPIVRAYPHEDSPIQKTSPLDEKV